MDQERANKLVAEANALHNAGDRLAAAPLYVSAAEAFPPYASFALVAGDSYLSAGQPTEAEHAYRTCLAGEPDHDQAWEGIGKALSALGRTDEAREAYGHAKVAFPGDRKGCLARLFGG